MIPRKAIGPLIGLTVIVATMAFTISTMKSTLISKLTFAEARKATDTTVQIIGTPVSGTMAYDGTAHALHFAMQDETGATMPVTFKGPKPEDMDSAMAKATKITAQGVFDPKQSTFVAENLLVKCPSKYQGQTGATERSYKS